jgi:hypothetical protein
MINQTISRDRIVEKLGGMERLGKDFPISVVRGRLEVHKYD